jgi:tRNA threonylcarbamoyladenosine biosynthesis protein TsaB
MLVLALDTTTPSGSCALAVDGEVLREEGSDASRSAAERLPADLMTILERARRRLDDVDVFAVATGPGSFTGLRIGIATMQGLAFAAGKPLVGVSGLDALERIGREEAAGRRIAAWVDAWRREVYAALYDQGSEVEAPVVARPDVLLSQYDATPTLFIGDGARTYRDVIQARGDSAWRVAEAAVPMLAGTIATLAASIVAAGASPPPHLIRPLYVRRTDAELARDGRAAG